MNEMRISSSARGSTGMYQLFFMSFQAISASVGSSGGTTGSKPLPPAKAWSGPPKTGTPIALAAHSPPAAAPPAATNRWRVRSIGRPSVVSHPAVTVT